MHLSSQRVHQVTPGRGSVQSAARTVRPTRSPSLLSRPRTGLALASSKRARPSPGEPLLHPLLFFCTPKKSPAPPPPDRPDPRPTI
eukprot:3841287-Pleurochrysis_carterae.AAC.1